MPTPRHLRAATLFAITLAAAGVAFGQAAAPAAPAVTPTPSCENPGDPPSASGSELGKSAAEAKRTRWTSSMKAYLDCLKTFIAAEQAAAQPHIRAANSGVDEFNKAIKVYNDYIDAPKQ